MSPEAKLAANATSTMLIPARKTEQKTANAHVGSKLVLKVTNADNELIVFVNTDDVYDRPTDGDPTFKEDLDLSSKLKKGHNSVVILGINWGGPAHFAGSLRLDDKELFEITFALPATRNGVVASWVADIHVS